MQILQILMSLVPSVIQAAQNGQASWKAFMDARKVAGDDEVNDKLDGLKAEFVRLKVLAEYQSQPGPQA